MSQQSPVAAFRETIPICAIGASAGGVVAVQALFSDLPADLGLVYVVVLHLSPDQPSVLADLLSRCTAMPAIQVGEAEKLKPDHVYIIPPNRELTIEGDRVLARPYPDALAHRTPIDTLFCSLASAQGDGIALVMTGAGQDGMHGVRAVKEGGGIVLAQDPADAEYPSMPRSAIETGAVDLVLPVALLAGKIGELARSKHAIVAIDEERLDVSVRRILAVTRVKTGHDFSKYKMSTVLRRIRRRVQLCRLENVEDYAAYVENNAAETENLFSDLLISVTAFFRDKSAFQTMQHVAARSLFEDEEKDLRVWSVGCASGEEAYSIAMLLLEESERKGGRRHIQLFATDLDEDALATARIGIYPRSIEHDVSEERLKRFFVDEGSHYRVCRQLRNVVLFAAHSVVRDPPFTRLDLVVCRNLTIYFDRQLQQQISALLHYALRTGGFLFLGPAELPDLSNGLFEVVDREARIYRSGSRRSASLPLLSRAVPYLKVSEARHRIVQADAAGAPLGAAHLAALEEHAPPSALVDLEGRVLNLSPNVGRFLLLPGGALSEKLPALVRPELRGELQIALNGVSHDAAALVSSPVDVAFDTEKRRVFLHVARLPAAQGAADRALVSFLDAGQASQMVEEGSLADPRLEEIRLLRAELSEAQQAALLGRAEHDSALQDLRAANGELQSLNEEYRSTAEELETSKEELQSVNEELHTVNAELKKKVEVISGAHNDLLNLTDSSEIGTLFLDPDLRIRMFTPPIANLFTISEIDVGRRITDFSHRFEHDSMELEIRKVLSKATLFEEEIKGPQGRRLLLRIRPYRTTDGRVSGVVVTFNDITTRKRETLEESEARFKAFVSASFDVVFRMSPDWSAMIRLEGRNMLADTVQPSSTWMETYILPEDRGYIRGAIESAIRDKTVYEVEHRIRRRDGSVGWTLSRAVPVLDASREIVEWLGTATDVSARHAATAVLRASEERLQQMVDRAPSLLSEADAEGNITIPNSQWSAYTGLSYLQLRGAGWLDAIHPEEVDAARIAFTTAFAGGAPFQREQRIRRADGIYRRFLVRQTPHFDEGGRVIHWFGAALDIDELDRTGGNDAN